MSLNELVGTLEPPITPQHTNVNWGDAEIAMRIGLPDDYREFIQTYGTGSIDDFLWILNPASPNKHLNLLDQFRVALNALRELRTTVGTKLKYSIFPEPGGLIPWGISDNGDVCFWRTGSTDPNAWPVVVHDSRVAAWEEYPGTMTEYLSAILSRKYSSSIFPDDFPADRATFQPA